MRAEHFSGPVTAAVIAVMALAAPGFGQGQPPPATAPTPAASGPEQGVPGQAPTGQRGAPQGHERFGRFVEHVDPTPRTPTGPTVKLPAPRATSETSLEQTLWGRQTMHRINPAQVTLQEVSELLWAAQGVTGTGSRRAAPSLGGAYALSALLVAGDVAGVPAGLYRYYPELHVIERVAEGDRRREIAPLCKFPNFANAPAIVVITGDESRMETVVPAAPAAHHTLAIEAGAASQNVVLEAVALGLGSAVVPDSDAAKLAKILQLPPHELPFVVVLISRQ